MKNHVDICYLMYWHELFDGCELYVADIVTHNLLMFHVALIMHVT